jgi:preprotein translocase subunit YajC
MAIYINAVPVRPDDAINIPKPEVFIAGVNTGGPGTTLTDVGKGFTNPVTNPKGFNITGGDVVYDSAGAIVEVIRVIDNDNIELSAAIANGVYEIYKGNYTAFTNSISPGYSLYITGAGDVRVVPVGDSTPITIPVVANQTLDLQVERVNATSTTATGIIALEVKQ